MTVKDPTRDITSQIDESDVLDYRTYLEKNSVPVATINRRLSTLRKYFTFCISQQWMTVNPGKQVSNHVSVTEKTSLAMPDTGDQALEAYTSFLKENYDANLVNEHRKVLEELLIISSN
jgi:site-specific recombinase XerD